MKNDEDEDEDDDKRWRMQGGNMAMPIGKAVRKEGDTVRYAASSEAVIAGLAAGAGQISLAKRGIAEDKSLWMADGQVSGIEEGEETLELPGTGGSSLIWMARRCWTET